MGDNERPVPDGDMTQEEQAANIRETGNGPTVKGEKKLIEAEFGKQGGK